MKQLEGKTAVVTGAASGMGLAMARRFARAGMKVVLSDIDEAKLSLEVDDIRRLGAEVIAVVADVSEEDQNHALFDATIDAFGTANVVCLNAGVQGSSGRSWSLSKAA